MSGGANAGRAMASRTCDGLAGRDGGLARLDAIVARERRRARRLRRRDLALAVLTPVVLLAAWQLAAGVGALDARLFPPPSRTFARAADMIASGQLLDHVLPTLARLSAGYLLGAVAGVAVGLAMGAWRPLYAALAPTFAALYALPKIAILPLLLLIFGLTETPRVLAVAITIFFVVQINTLAGIRQIDRGTLEAARAYGATGWRRFRFVTIPASLPSIFTGLRVAAGLGVVVITAVEFVASNEGLGYLIWNSWQLFQPERMYVGLVTVSVLGAAVTGLIALLEHVTVRWRRANDPVGGRGSVTRSEPEAR